MCNGADCSKVRPFNVKSYITIGKLTEVVYYQLKLHTHFTHALYSKQTNLPMTWGGGGSLIPT